MGSEDRSVGYVLFPQMSQLAGPVEDSVAVGACRYAAGVIRLLSWNMDNQDLWETIPTDPGFDVALVQEARRPGGLAALELVPGLTEPWETSGWKRRNWRTAIARFSDEVSLRPHKLVAGHEASVDALEVSRPGTLTVADVVRGEETLFTVASVYGVWESPAGHESPVYSDASAHRLLSDVAGLVTKVHKHRLIVAGDWNILYGYGEKGDRYWQAGTRACSTELKRCA